MTAPAPTTADRWQPTTEAAVADVDRRTAANLRHLGAAGLVAVPLLQAVPAVGPLCPLRRTTGVPCPACGSTTAVNALGRGDLVGALSANPAAVVLVLLVVVAWVAWLVGRPALPVRTRTIGRTATVAVPVLWLHQLHRHDLV